MYLANFLNVAVHVALIMFYCCMYICEVYCIFFLKLDFAHCVLLTVKRSSALIRVFFLNVIRMCCLKPKKGAQIETCYQLNVALFVCVVKCLNLCANVQFLYCFVGLLLPNAIVSYFCQSYSRVS